MKRIPTLTTAGWISDVLTKAIQIMKHFRAAEYSQTQLFKGQVQSLPYLVRTYGNDQRSFVTELRNSLYIIFNRHFSSVSVNVDPIDLTDEPGLFGVKIDVVISEDGQNFSLGTLLKANDNKIITYQIEGQ